LASRRKYKAPRAYRDGGAVIPDDVVPVPAPPSTDVLPAVSAPSADSDAVKRALEATLHAETLQQQAPRTVAEHIDRLPISDHKKRFLHDHPEMLDDTRVRAMGRAWNDAIAANIIPDDTPAMDQYILDRVSRETGSRHQHGIDDTPMPAAPPPPIERTADHPQSRRSIPMSAPVSRDVPSPSGRRMSERLNITLSPLEREIARNSFSSDQSIEERERLYATKKSLMLQMRQDGTLNE
jgi:hypothetical protein